EFVEAIVDPLQFAKETLPGPARDDVLRDVNPFVRFVKTSVVGTEPLQEAEARAGGAGLARISHSARGL
ncbi:MAG TPA: hypothetical protein VK864_16825, partial [Longimicrobiales bacterium]|nr:hypothetical protein [Longimicrobiales bacterium]